ncbi:MAG TPA: two-component system regulatory protein YycI [Virgibacillus sp.]|nr:two-component system regulatory protein YycI [Virgibacillus sp.]
MQWNQIKTIFILCFLVLDVYLLIKFIDKQEQTDLGVLEHENTSIEQQLASEDISLPELPTDIEEEEHYISVSPREFSEDDLEKLGKDQSPVVVDDDRRVISTFKDPISIPVDESDEDIKRAISNDITDADQYTYWGRNEELNVLIFFQKKEDKPIYYNENGIIFVFLNDDDEATFYTQTMLEETETSSEEYSLIEPIKAIESLYNSNELQTGDEISSIDMGFHTRIPLESGVQVFSPTWRVTVNDDNNYFVNAIEGIVYSRKELSFLDESIDDISEKVDTIKDKDVKKKVMKLLKAPLDILEEGEQEE